MTFIMRHQLHSNIVGMTLLEVMAGLAILGTLFTAMLFAQHDHRAQFEKAQRKIVAVEAADELLTHWWTDPRTLPRDAHGRVDEAVANPDPGMANLTWRTSRITQANADRLDVQVVRLEIFTPSAADPSPQTPDVLVDVVLPREGSSDGQ
jgi:type II secretory pathway pseudopilin PulG